MNHNNLSDIQVRCLQAAGASPDGIVVCLDTRLIVSFSRSTARALSKRGLLEYIPAATAWAHYRITALGREKLAALNAAGRGAR